MNVSDKWVTIFFGFIFACLGLLCLTTVVWLIGGMAGWWEVSA